MSLAGEEQLKCLKSMEAQGLFQLIIYDYKYSAEERASEVLSSGIKEYFGRLLEESNCNINVTDEVFVSNSGAYCAFELFLTLTKIPYSLVEFSKNEFADRRLVRSINQYDEISLAYRNLVFSAGSIIGANEYCKKHIYCSNSKLDKTLPGETYFFDPLSLKDLRNETKEKILAAYPEMNFAKVAEISALLVPNSESLTKRAIASCGSYIRDNIAPYTLLIDLMKIPSERLMIKPHPHGTFSFETRFSHSILFDKTFPIEFLQLLPNCRIEQMISVETSAVDKVSNLVDVSITASRYWMLKFMEVIPLYTILLLEAKLLDYKFVCFCPHLEGMKEIVQVLCACVEHGKLAIENHFWELGTSELVVSSSYKNVAQFSHYVHKYTIIRKNTADTPVFSDGSSSLYLAGNISSTECKRAETSFCLNHSGIKVIVKYEGEC